MSWIKKKCFFLCCFTESIRPLSDYERVLEKIGGNMQMVSCRFLFITQLRTCQWKILILFLSGLSTEHVSANVDTDDLYDEVYEEIYQ